MTSIAVIGLLSALPLLQDAPKSSPQLSDGIRARVDQLFAAYDKSTSPGCALGLIRDGKVLYRNAYGSANLDFRLPLTPNSIFDIGSTSKQFSALSILLLEQDGKLSLDDDVRKHVPELPDYGSRITIRHLLNHTSGLRDYLTLATLALHGPDDFYTDDDVVRMLARQKELNFSPGSEYLYSNSGFFLLSTIVRRASGGKSMRQFAEERILKPLEMTNTHFHDDHTEIVRNRATGYAPVSTPARFRISMSALDMVGDGGIYTSVMDMAKWDRNFYSHQVGGEALLARMQEPSKLSDGKQIPYGLGLMVAPYRGLPSVSHGGSWAGFRAELLRFPSEKFSVICLCNLASTNPSRLARQVADIVLEGRLPEPATAQPESTPVSQVKLATFQPDSLSTYTGTYKSDELGGVEYRLEAENGSLVLQGRNKRALMPVAQETFALGPARIRFDASHTAGGRTGFVVEAGRVRNIRFERVVKK